MWPPAPTSCTFKRWAGLSCQLGAVYPTPTKMPLKKAAGHQDNGWAGQLAPGHSACGLIIVGNIDCCPPGCSLFSMSVACLAPVFLTAAKGLWLLDVADASWAAGGGFMIAGLPSFCRPQCSFWPLMLWTCTCMLPWLQPVASSRGRGVRLVADPAAFPAAKQCIVQRYVPNPATLQGFKVSPWHLHALIS